ncbi:MAG: (Fe-S)-binding protein [Prevotellaceae bacterium]|jgi:glycolate oxidase iron-sulfur subunit|nr:(Fe-S)-binding protein [Prevotellaceae bacterium]
MKQKNKKNASLAKLTQQLLAIDDSLTGCMRCGLCQAVCPVYGVTLKEADVSRGKIALLENMAYEMLKDADGLSERLDRCLLCGSCQTNCPSGVNTIEIFLHARQLLAEYKGLSGVKKIIFRFILPHPKLMSFFVAVAGRLQRFFRRKANKNMGMFEFPLLRPFAGKRHFQPLAAKTFSAKYGKINTSAAKSGIKIAFFPGCVPDKLFVRVAEASLKVFEKHDVGVFMPDTMVCCGIPNLVSGDYTSFKRLVKINLDLLSQAEFDYLVSPCATCVSSIKENWFRFRKDFTDGERLQIEKIHDKTVDITEFLVDVLNVDFTQSANAGCTRRVTYHDSCHLKKTLGIFAQPRKILKNLSGLEFVEMPEADRCCGSGGSFTLTQHALANKIGQRKRNNAVSVKPDIVAAACPACMLQLMDMLSQNGDNVEVKHVVELYAEQLTVNS